MPKIVEEEFYDGAQQKIERLGLEPLLNEIRSAVTEFELLILEKKNSNGAAWVRERIDEGFAGIGGWTPKITGDIDWYKCLIINGTKVCVGVEVQVSARSDLIFRDVIHFRNKMVEGLIDLAVLVLPADNLAYYLTDRTPSMSNGKRIVGEEMRAVDLPLVLMSFQHDGPSDQPLPKKKTNLGRK